METTKRAMRAGALLVGGLALAKLLLHLLTTGRFGDELFVDELYFLDCSRHLAWGFVDMPPLFPALAAAIRVALGESLLAVRLLPALSGAALVVLTGLLARELGGRAAAMGLSSLAVLTAPVYLVLHSLHTMNQLEPLLWTGSALVMARIANGGSARLWLLFGALAGVGLLNKHSMAFFGAAAVVALLATPARRAFRERWIWLGGLLALALFLPNLVWEIRHRFPHLEMLANIARDGRDVRLSPLAFLGQQVLLVNPLALPLWGAGLAWLLLAKDARPHRALGVLYLALLGLMLLLNGRVYYLASVYPILFAAGGVALERLVPRARVALPAYAALLLVSGALLAPLAFPCVPPETYVRYTKALGMAPPPIETHRLGPLPQLLADRWGWREMAEEVARIHRELPEADRAKAAVFAQNYGQAGAINHHGPALGLPRAISGHLAHWTWGPGHAGADVVIVLDDDRPTLETFFESVEWGGAVSHRWSMPYEHFDVWVCRRPKGWKRWDEVWPKLKRWN